jgi:hypothetical protein
MPLGEGTIGADPLYADDDLRLEPGSPCIDSGTASDAPDHDFDSARRPFGSGFDMGAFEYGAGSTGEGGQGGAGGSGGESGQGAAGGNDGEAGGAAGGRAGQGANTGAGALSGADGEAGQGARYTIPGSTCVVRASS